MLLHLLLHRQEEEEGGVTGVVATLKGILMDLRIKKLKFYSAIFSRVLRDSTPRFVGPSVRRSVGRSHFTFCFFFAVFGLSAPAQMIW